MRAQCDTFKSVVLSDQTQRYTIQNIYDQKKAANPQTLDADVSKCCHVTNRNCCILIYVN